MSKHVIGFTSHHGRETAIVYLQIDGAANPYEALAESISQYEDSWLKPDLLRASLIYYMMDFYGSSDVPVSLTVHEPATDHTIHIVDTLKQEVQLFDKDSKNLLVSFGYDKFRERYGY